MERSYREGPLFVLLCLSGSLYIHWRDALTAYTCTCIDRNTISPVATAARKFSKGCKGLDESFTPFCCTVLCYFPAIQYSVFCPNSTKREKEPADR